MAEISILVAYSSKHGATREIAERIAENLREAGQDADARPVRETGDLDDYEGFVLGSAAYMGHWLKDATGFVRSNQDLLAQGLPIDGQQNSPYAAIEFPTDGHGNSPGPVSGVR